MKGETTMKTKTNSLASLSSPGMKSPAVTLALLMKRITLFVAVMLAPCNILFAQVTSIREYHQQELREVKLKPEKIQFDKIEPMINIPNVSISLEPKDGDYLLYHPTPGFTFFEAPKAQLSMLAFMHNKESENVDLDKVMIEYKKGNSSQVKTSTLPADRQIVEPGYVRLWQNGRDYHQAGDVVYLESPLPSEVRVKFYFKNFGNPVTVVKKLKAFSAGFALPFKASDLKKDEYWSSYSMHGGGGQVFAYDLGVEGYANGGWNGNLPGANGSQHDDARVWGKPIYAMADGVVMHSLNECPNNPGPIIASTKEEADQKAKEQMDKYWGKYKFGGAGNHFYIRHGAYVALYAHMQKGSLNSKLLAKGSAVKKGDLLGYAGNSGSSSGPHLHVHLYTYKNDDEPEGGYYRPLLFNNGYVIGKQNYAKPITNVNWSRLDNEGIPGLVGKASFIWPSEKHLYCSYPTNGGEIAKHGVPEASFQAEFDKIWTCGYYPVWMDGYDVNGDVFFNLIFRPSAGVNWVARHNMDGDTYQSEFNKWTAAGYKLLFVDSYLKGSKVLYAAVWKKDARTIMAYHGIPLSVHEANFKNNAQAGWVPVNVSPVSVGGQIYVTALWEKKNTGGFYLRPAMTLQQYKDAFKQYTDKEGFRLTYINGYVRNGEPMLSAIWQRNAPNYSSWWAKHYLTAGGYQNEFNTYTSQGYSTRCVTGYESGNGHRFEGVWAK